MSRLQQLLKLYEVDPSDADVLYMLAQEHATRGDHAEALAWFDRCVDTDGAYCYAYFHKARSLESLGRVDEAMETLRLGVGAALASDDAKAQGEIAGYLEALGG